MSYYDVFNDPTGHKIIKAFIGPENLWRTPGGVAREVGLPVEQVQSYINEHPDIFVRSTLTASGTALIGLRDDLKQEALKSTRQ
jgi:hypothetical protein